MKTADEIIKESYPFYDPDLSTHDVELNGEQVANLMLEFAEQSKWIDSKERLPEYMEGVIAWCVGPGWEPHIRKATHMGNDVFLTVGIHAPQLRITHWQPPPKNPDNG